MRRLFLLLLLLLLLFSCAKESFDISSCTLKRDSDVEMSTSGSILAYEEKLVLSASFSNDEINYSFQIKSPDNDLTWEGDYKDGGVDLGITAGAMLPSGDYHAIFYGDNGTEKSIDIPLSPIDNSFPYINDERVLITNNKLSIVEYNSNVEAIKRVSSADSGYTLDINTSSVIMEFVDRYLNTITISESL